jgi:hypothetical protein
LADVDDLVVELQLRAPAQEHVDLLLVAVLVAERNPEVRREALVAEPGALPLERLPREPRLEVGREAGRRRRVLDLLLQVRDLVSAHGVVPPQLLDSK